MPLRKIHHRRNMCLGQCGILGNGGKLHVKMMRDLSNHRIAQHLISRQQLLQAFLRVLQSPHSHQQSNANAKQPLLNAEINKFAVKFIDTRHAKQRSVVCRQPLLQQPRPSAGLTQCHVQHRDPSEILTCRRQGKRLANTPNIVICAPPCGLQDSPLREQQQLYEPGIDVAGKPNGLLDDPLDFLRAQSLAPTEVHDPPACQSAQTIDLLRRRLSLQQRPHLAPMLDGLP